VAACRLCLVEIEGSGKLQPACITPVLEGMGGCATDSPTLRGLPPHGDRTAVHRGEPRLRVCVANGHCELQDRAVEVGMDHSRLPYRFPDRAVDLSHQRFGLDHNRCILCTAACGSATRWRRPRLGRGLAGRALPDHRRARSALGAVDACTDCGKCVMVCPTGALFPKGDTVEEKHEDPSQLVALLRARQARQGAPP